MYEQFKPHQGQQSNMGRHGYYDSSHQLQMQASMRGRAEMTVRLYLSQNEEYLWKRIKNALLEATLQDVIGRGVSAKQKIQDYIYDKVKNMIATVKGMTNNNMADQIKALRKQEQKLVRARDELEAKIRRRQEKIKKMEAAVAHFLKHIHANAPNQSSVFDIESESMVKLKGISVLEEKNKINGAEPTIHQAKDINRMFRCLLSILKKQHEKQKQAVGCAAKAMISKFQQKIETLCQSIEEKQKSILQLRLKLKQKQSKFVNQTKMEKQKLYERFGQIIQKMQENFEKQKQMLKRKQKMKEDYFQILVNKLMSQIGHKQKLIQSLSTKLQKYKLVDDENQKRQKNDYGSDNPWLENKNMLFSINHLFNDVCFESWKQKQNQFAQTDFIVLDEESISSQSQYIYQFDRGTQYEEQFIERQNTLVQQQNEDLFLDVEGKIQEDQLKIMRINHLNSLQEVHRLRSFVQNQQLKHKQETETLFLQIQTYKDQIDCLNKNNLELIQTIQYANSLFMNGKLKEIKVFECSGKKDKGKSQYHTQSTFSQKSTESDDFSLNKLNNETNNYDLLNEHETAHNDQNKIDRSAVSRLLAEFVNTQIKYEERMIALDTLVEMLHPQENQKTKILHFLEKSKKKSTKFETSGFQDVNHAGLSEKLYQFLTEH